MVRCDRTLNIGFMDVLPQMVCNKKKVNPRFHFQRFGLVGKFINIWMFDFLNINEIKHVHCD